MNNEYNNIGIEPSENNSIEQPSPINEVPVTEPTPVVSETPQADSPVSNNEEMAQPETTVGTSEISTNTNDAKKTTNIRTIIILAVILVVGAIIGVVFFVTGKSSSGGIFSSGEKITAKEIESYGIESIARWGNLSLGVSYLIPKSNEGSSLNGSVTSSYLHGHTFWCDGYITVEKSLEGNTNLESLVIDINKEKALDKYNGELESNYKKDLTEIALTKKVRIDKTDSVYFEGKQSDTESIYGSSLNQKYLGYCFEYEKSYYCVYGRFNYSPEDADEQIKEKEDLLRQRLQYIISSFKPYNGESFYELDKNFNLASLFDGWDLSENFSDLEVNEKQMIINQPSGHDLNGIYQQDHTNMIRNKMIGETLDLSTWDGKLDSIYDFITNHPTWYRWTQFVFDAGYSTGEQKLQNNLEILEEKEETINGIQMKKYIGKYKFMEINNKTRYYVVLYTFILNNKPYMYQAYLDPDYDVNISSDVEKNIIKSLDLNAETWIRTMRIIDYDDNNEDLVQKYT